MAGSGARPINRGVTGAAAIPAMVFEDGFINPASLNGVGRVRVNSLFPNAIGVNSQTPDRNDALFPIELRHNSALNGSVIRTDRNSNVVESIDGGLDAWWIENSANPGSFNGAWHYLDSQGGRNYASLGHGFNTPLTTEFRFNSDFGSNSQIANLAMDGGGNNGAPIRIRAGEDNPNNFGIFNVAPTAISVANKTLRWNAFNSAVIGGSSGELNAGADNSVILGGTNNSANHARAIIAGGQNINTNRVDTLFNQHQNSFGDQSISAAITVTINGGTVNNYNTTGLEEISILRINATAVTSISGIDAPTPSRGKMLYIRNIGTANISLLNNNGGSALNNRFSFNADQTILPNEMVHLWYDYIENRWTIIN